MSNSKEPEADIQIVPKAPKVTPPGYELQVSEAHAQMIAELVSSPVFKILKRVIIPMRRDQIARAALNNALTLEQLYSYKGMAAELQLLFKSLTSIKTEYEKRNRDAPEEKQFKK